MNREIILGFDPDHSGDDVLRLGRLLSEVLASTPHVVTALPWPSDFAELPAVERQLAEDMRERFSHVRESLHDLAVETETVPSGSPAAALQDVAERDGALAIVLGSCHRGRVGRTLAGSVGESLLHGAPCAVAIAPRDYADHHGDHLQRIGVAYDGSAESEIALETAIGLAERCHALISVISVADYPNYGYASAWTLLSTGEFRDAERIETERLHAAAVGPVPSALEHESRVLTGDPASELIEVSGEFDLMVAGSRSWGPLKRTMLGSTTRKLIRASASPVLVLPRGTGPDPLRVRVDSVRARVPAAVPG